MPDLARTLPVTFRPKVARVWAYVIGTLIMVASIILALSLPSATFGTIDRVGFMAFGAVILWFCHRQASVSVHASESGLVVRNLFTTHSLAWAEVFAVSFPEGDPWAHLDLANGDVMSAMALQRADRTEGVRMARELNALIGHYGTAP